MINRRTFLAAAGAVLAAPHVRAAPADAKTGPAATHLDLVRRYADALIEHGRDVYGEVKSPLFSVTLDRKTLKLPAQPPRGISGIRSQDRILNGANPMHDENLYQILYALSALTGDRHYGEEADRALGFFFEHCQSPQTGLLAWGEHLGWGFERDTLSGGSAEYHEFFRPWVLWDRSFALAPDACRRFARGLWDNQIHNHDTGEFSRHARWSRRETGGGNEYPRHGGFYIMTWARAYRESKDPVFAHAVETLLGLYRRNSSPLSGAIACCSRKDRAKIMWPESNLSLAVSLELSASVFPAGLRDQMVEMAGRIDQVYGALKHDFSPAGPGFVAGAHADTLEAFTTGEWTHTELFATAYGKATDSQVANLCHLRLLQLGDAARREKFARLILAAADRYLNAGPDLGKTVYPGPFGDTILHLLAAHSLSGKPAYLERARFFARLGVEVFLKDGSPLPRASSQNDHYEAITRADTLMMALLKLWQVENRPEAEISLVYDDR